MCVISVKKKGSSITAEEFKKMWDRNDDGAGFVGRLNDKSPWVHEKGIMSFDEAKEKILPYLASEAELILHFRIKSKGEITPEMTHPFDFSRSDKEKRYIFHNGTVKLFAAANGCSDSFHLASLIKPVGTRSVYKILEHLVKDGNGRFVTFIQKSEAEAEIKIFGDAESSEVDGVWYSNTRHNNPTHTVVHQPTYYGRGSGNSYPPALPPSQTSSVEKTETANKIIDYYIRLNKKENTEANRVAIYEHYSMSLMCEKFLTEILQKIDKGQEEGDIISRYFDI